MRHIFLLIIGGVIFVFPGVIFAESSSTNYKLWGHSFSSSGAQMSSTNYQTNSTASDTSSAAMESSEYISDVGVAAIYEEPQLSMSLSSSSVALGELSTGSVASGAITVSVSTNAPFGYSLSAVESSVLQNGSSDDIDDVSDGEVTAGSEEFGVAVTGAAASFADDRSLSSTARVVASTDSWVVEQDSTVTFKAAISSATESGSYSGSYAFIATPNF